MLERIHGLQAGRESVESFLWLKDLVLELEELGLGDSLLSGDLETFVPVFGSTLLMEVEVVVFVIHLFEQLFHFSARILIFVLVLAANA